MDLVLSGSRSDHGDRICRSIPQSSSLCRNDCCISARPGHAEMCPIILGGIMTGLLPPPMPVAAQGSSSFSPP